MSAPDFPRPASLDPPLGIRRQDEQLRNLEGVVLELLAELKATTAQVEGLAAQLERLRAERARRPWWSLPW